MIDYSEIRVNIPRIKIIKLNEHIGYIPHEELPALMRKLVEVDIAINKLLHVKSVLERILLKT